MDINLFDGWRLAMSSLTKCLDGSLTIIGNGSSSLYVLQPSRPPPASIRPGNPVRRRRARNGLWFSLTEEAKMPTRRQLMAALDAALSAQVNLLFSKMASAASGADPEG